TIGDLLQELLDRIGRATHAVLEVSQTGSGQGQSCHHGASHEQRPPPPRARYSYLLIDDIGVELLSPGGVLQGRTTATAEPGPVTCLSGLAMRAGGQLVGVHVLSASRVGPKKTRRHAHRPSTDKGDKECISSSANEVDAYRGGR